jgi:pantetheine-phosphate adenylyltransferase
MLGRLECRAVLWVESGFARMAQKKRLRAGEAFRRGACAGDLKGTLILASAPIDWPGRRRSSPDAHDTPTLPYPFPPGHLDSRPGLAVVPPACTALHLAAMPHAQPPAQPHHLVIYPGSFDPITFGHLDIIERARNLFDELVIAVGRNPGKDQLFAAEERVEIVETLIAPMLERDGARVHVEAFSGLTVDFARHHGATALLRGVRNTFDLQYEVQQALTNREVAGLETAFIVAGQSFAYTSSSLIKQITAMAEDLDILSSMVPPLVIERLREKKREGNALLERLRNNHETTAE